MRNNLAEYLRYLDTQRICGSLPENSRQAIARSFLTFQVEPATLLYQ
ncbi:hypothetical protein PN499_10055 [Kamptonema animale CS-326]|nr:hypothetical protein [Kamptonema animale]MDB9511524.1 hypothetical protein [Kamptonema animale CS-326]